MAAARDARCTGSSLELRLRPVAARRARSAKVREHVELGERSPPSAAALRARAPSVIEQRVVQLLLARQRALARRQHLVLECLELRRDVALGVLQRLPARCSRAGALSACALLISM